MKYPLRSPYLKYKRVGKDEFMIENWLYRESYRASRRSVSFLHRLNGKRDPYKLLPDYRREEVGQLLDKLRDYNLLAPKREVTKLGIGAFIYPLIYCYPSKTQRNMAGIFNAMLFFFFVPMLFLGRYQNNHTGYFAMHDFGELFLGMAVGILTGITLHELSHAAAGVSYGAHVSEIGIGSHFFLPSAYVLMDEQDVAGRFRKVQIHLAGVEMNIFLYGVFMSLAASGLGNTYVFYVAGVINLGLGIVNALPLKGMDGMSVLSYILGKEDLLQCAVRTVRSCRKRKPGNKPGHVAIVAASYALIGFQVVLPLLLIYEWYSIVALVRMIL